MKKQLLRTVSALLFILFLSLPSMAQSKVEPDSSQADLFDFWIGKWDLTWDEAEGKKGKGTNEILRIMSGKIIQENFKAIEGQLKGYDGMSVSAYNPSAKTWNQTWVDNQGGYLDFEFEMDGDKRIFKREGLNPKQQKVYQRMVFYDIKKDSFNWDWESSTDGKEWKLQWRIAYKRQN